MICFILIPTQFLGHFCIFVGVDHPKADVFFFHNLSCKLKEKQLYKKKRQNMLSLINIFGGERRGEGKSMRSKNPA